MKITIKSVNSKELREQAMRAVELYIREYYRSKANGRIRSVVIRMEGDAGCVYVEVWKNKGGIVASVNRMQT